LAILEIISLGSATPKALRVYLHGRLQVRSLSSSRRRPHVVRLTI